MMASPTQQGEPSGLAAYSPQLRARARGLIGPKLRPIIASSDLLQETLLIAVRKFAAISGRPRREVLAWLTQVMRHRLLTYLRKYRRELDGGPLPVRAGEPSKGTERALSALVLEELRRDILAEIEALPELERTVINALYKERCSIAEISVRLKRTDGAVRAIHQRAVKRLRMKLVNPTADR